MHSLICFVGLKAQQTKASLFTECIDSIYADNSCSSDSDFKYMNTADSLILSTFLIQDTDLVFAVDRFISYRDSLLDETGYYGISNLKFEQNFRDHCLDFYILHKHFPDLTYNELISYILSNEYLHYLDYLAESKDTNFLKDLIRDTSKRKKMFGYVRLIEIFDSSSMSQFYFNNSQYFREYDDLYFKLLESAKEKNKPNKLLPDEESTYLGIFDTSGYRHKMYYYYYFKNGPNPFYFYEDSLHEANRYEDSLKFVEYIMQRQAEQEEYYRINDSINGATIYDRFPAYWKHAYSDTTLWMSNGSIPVLEVDDGMRFDTLTTAEIFNRLNAIDFHEVYDTAQSMWSLNHKVVTIHLRKIFQILGDRCAYGIFVPDSNQRIILDQWIEDYKYMACNDSLSFKKTEACYQLLRFWRLLYPKLKNWIGIETKCSDGMNCVLQELTKMVTEAMVLDIIADGDAALANGDTARVETLGYFLARVWRDLEIPAHEQLYRRPARTAVETQQWVDAYIYPALVRWNHPTSWR